MTSTLRTPPPASLASRWAAVLLAGTCTIGLASAQAQTTAQPQTGAAAATPPAAASPAGTSASGARVSRHDRSFVLDAATDGLAEVMLGKLAQAHAASTEVKQFGEQMVTDHTKANEELAALARARGIAVPDKPTSAQQRMHDSMAKMKGAEFDRLYMAHMTKDHRKAVKLFQEQAKAGDDAELKAFAQKTLPTLEAHRQKADALHDSLKGQRR